MSVRPGPSSRHSNVAFASVEWNGIWPANFVRPIGPPSMIASGPVTSTITVRPVDGPETFPAASRAVAVYVWLPSGTDVSWRDQVPAAVAVVVPREAVPSKTSTVELASAVPDSVKVCVPRTALFAGAVIAGAAGACVSTVHVRVAGVASVLPAASVARTCEGVRALR